MLCQPIDAAVEAIEEEKLANDKGPNRGSKGKRKRLETEIKRAVDEGGDAAVPAEISAQSRAWEARSVDTLRVALLELLALGLLRIALCLLGALRFDWSPTKQDPPPPRARAPLLPSIYYSQMRAANVYHAKK